jgi:roadblock/LC7 domain-containing protein
MGGSDDDSAQPTSKAGSKRLQTKGLNSHKKAGKAVAFSPNGLVLASTSYKTVRLWNTATGKEIQELKAHRGAVNAIAFSPDGKTIASASDDSTVRLWDVATGKTQELEGHGGAVNAIAFSPDGKTVASASDDSTVRLWEVATGLEIHRLLGHNTAVKAIAFSPDGKVVASTSDDSTVRFWDAAAGEQLQKHENPHYDLPTTSSINLTTDPFNEPDGIDPTLKLNEAIRRRDTNSVITLIASGIDVNRPFNGSKREWLDTPDFPEGYPIYYAAEVGKEMTQLLIDAGANVNTRFKSFPTALQNAAGYGTYETMELLIDAGADVNAPPGAGSTALIEAITHAEYDFKKVHLLLRHGADVHTPSFKLHRTPIEEATRGRHTEVVPLLVAHGVSIADAVAAWKTYRPLKFYWHRNFPELWLRLSRKHPYKSVSQIMVDIEDASAVKTIKSIKLDWKAPELLGSENKSDPVVMHEGHPLVNSYMEQFVLVDDWPEGSEVDTVLGATCFDCVHDHWGQNAVGFLRCLLNNILSQRQGNSERMYPTLNFGVHY